MSKEDISADRHSKDHHKRDDMTRHDIFADRRSGDRRKRSDTSCAPSGGCRRKASRRSGREYSAMPWYLRAQYTHEEPAPTADERSQSRSRRDFIRKII